MMRSSWEFDGDGANAERRTAADAHMIVWFREVLWYSCIRDEGREVLVGLERRQL